MDPERTRFIIKQNYLIQMEFIQDAIVELKHKLRNATEDDIISCLKRDVLPTQIAEQELMLDKLIKRYNKNINLVEKKVEKKQETPMETLRKYMKENSASPKNDVIHAVISLLTQTCETDASQ